MPDKKSTIENIPGKEVGKVVQGFVTVQATNITCTKSSDNTWTIVAIIPEKASHVN
jgi:hypothetical protein